MLFLKQSTAATILIGPVLDSNGGLVTSGVVIGDLRITKNGTTTTMSGNTLTHSHAGHWSLALGTGDTDTTNRLTISNGNTSYAMPPRDYTVLLASVFDALITNATNSTGGFATATGSITALAGAIATTTNITQASGVTLAATTHTGAVIPTVSTVTNGVTVTTNNDKTGYSLSQAFPSNFSSLAITAGGAVTAGTVSDKTGYSLSQSFPSNFASMNLDTSGRVLLQPTQTGVTIPTVTSVTNGVTASTVSDKTGYSLTPTTGLGNQTANITGNLSGSVGSVTGSVGSISGVTFPSNFASLGINASGHVSRVTLVDTTTTNTDMRGTDGAALASAWTATRAGYLDSVLLAQNSNRTVQVTGSNHVAADVHEFQAGVITAIDFSTGAIDANALATDAANEIATAVAATQALSRLDSMIESDGAGQFRFDTIALSMAPAGGGGGGTDWTANERTAIRSILGIPTSGTTPTDPSVGILDEIRDNINAIGINVYPVSASTPDRVSGTTLVFYLKESRSVTIGTDFTLDSLTLQFVVEDNRGNDVYTVADGSISRSGTTATIPVTTAVTNSLGQYAWSLRDITSGNSVIARGVLSVQIAAAS